MGRNENGGMLGVMGGRPRGVSAYAGGLNAFIVFVLFMLFVYPLLLPYAPPESLTGSAGGGGSAMGPGWCGCGEVGLRFALALVAVVPLTFDGVGTDDSVGRGCCGGWDCCCCGGTGECDSSCICWS